MMEWFVSSFGWFPELYFFQQPSYDFRPMLFLIFFTVLNWRFKDLIYEITHKDELQVQKASAIELPLLRNQLAQLQLKYQKAEKAEVELAQLKTKYQASQESNQENEAQVKDLRVKFNAQIVTITQVEKDLAEVTEKWVKAEERATDDKSEVIELLLSLLDSFRQELTDYEAGLITENTLHHRQKKADTPKSSGDDKWDRNLL
jgi:hypothetical protein